MSWKLKQIKLENFKFFKETFTFDTECKHVLLYGENGSGKSSIAQGFYTLMESRHKSAADVQKYFTAESDQHLRNRYSSDPAETSYILATYNDVQNPPVVPPMPDKQYKISAVRLDTQANPDDFIAYTIQSSDIFSYRVLSEFTYEKNSKELNLYSLFDRDLFKAMPLSRPYTDVNGIVADSAIAADWWNYIKSVPTTLQRTGRGHFDKKNPQYLQFLRLLADFKNEIDTSFAIIETTANRILRDELKMADVNLNLSMTPIEFDKFPLGHPRKRDGKLYEPKITLTARVSTSGIMGSNQEIKHLATFFNEACLTCIGLALRLAISENKLITGGLVAPVLCIDDLLVSLDMGNRLMVIDLLLKCADRWQLLLFTHDKVFYNCVSTILRDRDQNGNWTFLEMFAIEPTLAGTPYPKPMCHKELDYRFRALERMNACDYAAAGNYLRKFAEVQIKNMLPANMKTGKMELGPLSDIMDGNFCKVYGINKALLPRMTIYRQRLLNPSSHDDADTPLYKQEIKAALLEIDKFQPIIDSIREICDGQGGPMAEYELSISNGGNTETVRFKVLERWTSLEVAGTRYFKDVKVYVISSALGYVTIGPQESLNKDVYKQVCSHLRFVHPNVPPELKDCITQVNRGMLFTTL